MDGRGSMLLFKKKFLDAIRSGHKTQTIRLWQRRMLRAGQRSYIPGVGAIQIDEVEPVELAQLSDEDSQRDGFASANQLREELHAIYGDQLASRQAFRVTFHVLARP